MDSRLLATYTCLHDIDDVEGFVRATLKRSRIRFDRSERDELICEGIAILYKLAADYRPLEPRHEGEQAGRFSGYAAQFLPRRLGDYWHRSHPEHRFIRTEDGSRQWFYGEPPASLDQARERAALRGSEVRIRQEGEWCPVPTSTLTQRRAA